jgi:TolB protein
VMRKQIKAFMLVTITHRGCPITAALFLAFALGLSSAPAQAEEAAPRGERENAEPEAPLDPGAGPPVPDFDASTEPALPARSDAGISMTEEGAIEIDVYGGVRDLYKIAVPLPAGSLASTRTIQGVATRDLEISSLFKVLDPRSFLADSDQEDDQSFDVDAWRAVGAQGVVQGRITGSGSKVNLQLRLHETARGQAPVITRSYNGSEEDIRDMVHQFVNDLIGYFTGETGVFGSRILFSRAIGRRHKEIMSVEMDGSNLQGHTKNGSINTMPAWGPGGSIFYTSFINGFAQIFRTGRAAPVVSQGGLNMGVAVAPNGGRMALVVSHDGDSDIYVANLDGSGLRNLTKHPAIDVSPTWSPDGSQIAFVSNRHGSPQIFVMGADGSGPRRITFAGSYNQTPAWCPRSDTPLIAFTGADGGTFDIFTVNATGGSITRLTQAQGRNSDPAWSPDGRLIAFWSSRGGIHLMTPEGLNQQLILRGHAEMLRWSMAGASRSRGR